MKKLILLSLAFVCVTFVFASSEKYYAKMGETLSEYANCQNASDFQALANKFKTISNVEKEEWLPLYYEAHCYVLMSFVSQGTAAEKDGFLNQAEDNFIKMLKIAPNESEVYALQAFYYMAKMVVDPAARAQQYTPLINQSVGKSLAIESGNPRAQYVKLTNEHGTAQFFGNDLTPYCDKAKAIIANWDKYELKSPLHPAWGKEMVNQIANSCNNQ